MKKGLGVLLLQLGSPKSPSEKDVRSFLRSFLGDPRVVDFKSIFWKILLYCYILPFRPKKVSKAYASIWKDGTFPLFKHTEDFSKTLQEEVVSKGSDDTYVRHAYIIGTPNIAEKIKELDQLACRRIRIIYQFPQFSEATTLSARDAVEHSLKQVEISTEVERFETFHTTAAYIDNLAAQIDEDIEREPVDRLLLSFHGYPLRRIFAGDDYFQHCKETAELIVSRLKSISPQHVLLTFQSQFGREEWLSPSTEETLTILAEQGIKKVAVACPAFLVDNLETDEEVGIGLKEQFLSEGGEHFRKISCLNSNPGWVKDFANDFILNDYRKAPSYEAKNVEGFEIPVQKYKSVPLKKEARQSLKVVFIVLLLDLIGFSIIFPLFPRMLEYYQLQEGGHGLFGWSMEMIHILRGWIGGTKSDFDVVLFGGILGSLYSLLQFLLAPFIGALSDRWGRKPILLISVFGISVSYLMWFFADTFALLVGARLLGGVMSANISTATAVVGDVTQASNRSKGMATIGIAFGLGFVIGPAVGAFASMVSLVGIWPAWLDYGINPFSMPAAVALILSLINLYFIIFNFKETLPKEEKDKIKSKRVIHPLHLFKVSQYPGVTLNNMIYFLFLFAFSGMEFTLTFLAFEKMNYSNLQQGMMFVYIGFILVMVQGGYVRRKANLIGERKMARQGLSILAPGLIIIGFSNSTFILYIGLLLMALGSAQVIPCLTALSSQYAPAHEQGRVIGIFRSLGALARATGPLIACFLYWKLGAEIFYVFGAILILLPLLMSLKLPEPKSIHGK